MLRFGGFCLGAVILICACGSLVLPAQAPSSYGENEALAVRYLLAQQRPDGAILTGEDQIIPYFSNLAAQGLTKVPGHTPEITLWMKWYIAHLNRPDQWGLQCTVYDYKIVNGHEVSGNDADSTDSYAATFASLAWSFWNSGDPEARTYLRSIRPQMACIGNAIFGTMQPDGLTWAKPDYKTAYLMDNCEVYRGLVDLADLFEFAYGDKKSAVRYRRIARRVKQGIETQLWDPAGHRFLPYAGAKSVNWKEWYPDATAQLFPVLSGALSASDPRSRKVYAQFNATWPDWPALQFPGNEPWVLVACAAAVQGDSARVNRYIEAVRKTTASPRALDRMQSADLGWFIRLNSYAQNPGALF